MSERNEWRIFKGTPKSPHDGIEDLPLSPSWRPFGREQRPGVSRRKHRGETFQIRDEEIDVVNAALFLRRPLLITGPPGTGKSSLAYAVAQELKLGEVLYWPITTRTTLKDGLYSYDAIGRLQDAKQNEKEALDRQEDLRRIGNYLSLGPLGTALYHSDRPRVLLIDEIDKSDIDLPNDLLTIFEEGRYEIPELVRIDQEIKQPISVRTAYTDETEDTWGDDGTFEIEGGRVTCRSFPFVVMTSNGERSFPPPFLRRCLRLDMKRPVRKDLERIVEAHFEHEFRLPTNAEGQAIDGDGQVLGHGQLEDAQQTMAEAKAQFDAARDSLIGEFLQRRDAGSLATDQLLNAIFLVTREKFDISSSNKNRLIKQVLRSLSPTVEDDDDSTLEEDGEV